MKSYLPVIAFIIFVINIAAEDIHKYTNSTTEYLEDTRSSSKVLSRRKRYLTFPDGSSFQLVFCAQNHGYLQIGDIVWFGNTAALAWELPSDPKYFYLFKEHKKKIEDTAHRRQDAEKHIYFLDEYGKVIGKRPYKRRPIVNPAFAKRSVDMKINRITAKEMHDMQREKHFLGNIPPEAIEFHREGRKDLYEKLETFFNALGWNGEECILRFLCEANKQNSKQGSFLEEIFRATFTLVCFRCAATSEAPQAKITVLANPPAKRDCREDRSSNLSTSTMWPMGAVVTVATSTPNVKTYMAYNCMNNKK